MGCSKSKSQSKQHDTNGRREHVHIVTEPWQVPQEEHSNGETVECNQYGLSNSVFYLDRVLNYDRPMVHTREKIGHDILFVGNNTGTFGGNVQTYFDGINSIQSSDAANEYEGNVCNQNFSGPSAEYNSSNYAFSQDPLHGKFYEGRCMGPPSRPSSVNSNHNRPCSARPLRRRHSLNDDYRRPHYNYNIPVNSLIRHNSLENIKPQLRERHFRNNGLNYASDDRLFQNSSTNESYSYPRRFSSRHNSSHARVQQRGLKRNNEWNNDYSESCNTLSDNSVSKLSLDGEDMPYVGHQVKRRPSNIDDYDSENIDCQVNGGKRCDSEVSCNEPNNNDNETILTSDSVDIVPCNTNETFDVLDLLLLPDEWSSCAIHKTGFVNVSLTSPEGRLLQKFFHRTSDSKEFKLCITSISRIENPFMHSFYLSKKEEMEYRNGNVDELYLYHGTKKENLSGILEDNLNWRLFSEKHRFGQGISFSPLATYSSHYCDRTSVKVMLLFKVLVSNSIGGSPDTCIPPIIDGVVYDATIKDDTTVIVKYSDNEFYPLYKITCIKVMKNS